MMASYLIATLFAVILSVANGQIPNTYELRVRERDNVNLWCDELARDPNNSNLIKWTRKNLDGAEELVIVDNGKLAATNSNRVFNKFTIKVHKRLLITDIRKDERGIFECSLKSTNKVLTKITVYVDPDQFEPTNVQKFPQKQVDGSSRSAWPLGVVPYKFDKNISLAEQNIFRSAFKELENGGSCVHFVDLASTKSKTTPLIIRKLYDVSKCEASDACYSSTGNEMRIGVKCLDKRNIMREMIRILCLDFELHRSDRDDYIKIDEEVPYSCAIPSDRTTDYLKTDILYDYLSVTHPKCRKSCLRPKVELVTKCGLKQFSSVDIEKINSAYGCKGCNAVYFKPISQISFGRDNLILTSEDKSGSRYGICRKYRSTGEISPGKFNVDRKSCEVWDHQDPDVQSSPSTHTDSSVTSVLDRKFEVLSNAGKQRYEWQWGGINAKLPERPIPGGRTADGTYLYFCRCVVFDQLSQKHLKIAGKLINSKCYIPGREAECDEHEFLNCVEDDGVIGKAATGDSSTWLFTAIGLAGALALLAAAVAYYFLKYNRPDDHYTADGLRMGGVGKSMGKEGKSSVSSLENHDYEAIPSRWVPAPPNPIPRTKAGPTAPKLSTEFPNYYDADVIRGLNSGPGESPDAYMPMETMAARALQSNV